MTPEEMRDCYDWGEVFACARRDGLTFAIGQDPSVANTEGFEIDHVQSVIWSVEGENDGPSWRAVVRLLDGRCAYLDAWCDYTGWGCQDGGSAVLASDLDALLQFGVPDDVRLACAGDGQ